MHNGCSHAYEDTCILRLRSYYLSRVLRHILNLQCRHVYDAILGLRHVMVKYVLGHILVLSRFID
jgi:hypothetical protein